MLKATILFNFEVYSLKHMNKEHQSTNWYKEIMGQKEKKKKTRANWKIFL